MNTLAHMHRDVDRFKQEHGQLRALLGQCEAASHLELRPLMEQLRQALRPHLEAKQGLYVQAVDAVSATGNATDLSLLNIFRTNLGVVSGAAMSFLETPDPIPERQKERLRTVTGALRSLLDTEEKVIFPLCVRHARPNGARPWQARPLAQEDGQ